jgi:glycosyltransferase 2 family protein
LTSRPPPAGGAASARRRSALNYLRNRLKFVALLLLAALLLWWFSRGLEWREVWRVLGHADWRLLAAAAFASCCIYPLSAARWRALLAPFTPASLREVFVATTVGFGAAFVAGRAGEVVRPVVLTLRDPRVRPGPSFVTILVERVCDLSAVALLFAVNLLWMSAPAGLEAEFAHLRRAGGAALAGVLLGLAGMVWFKRRSDSLNERLGRFVESAGWLPRFAGRVIHRLFEQLAAALRVFVNARELVVVTGWTAAMWATNTAATLLVIRAFGLPFGPSETVFVLGWTLVGSLVPTPGGPAGAYHAATAAGLVFLGAEREPAAAVAITLHLIAYAPALAFTVYYLLRGDITLARLRRLAAGGPENQTGAPARARP